MNVLTTFTGHFGHGRFVHELSGQARFAPRPGFVICHSLVMSKWLRHSLVVQSLVNVLPHSLDHFGPERFVGLLDPDVSHLDIPNISHAADSYKDFSDLVTGERCGS